MALLVLPASFRAEMALRDCVMKDYIGGCSIEHMVFAYVEGLRREDDRLLTNRVRAIPARDWASIVRHQAAKDELARREAL